MAYRAGFPAAALRERGHHAICSAGLSPQVAGVEKLEDLDLIVGQRMFKEGPSKTFRELKGKVALVVEHDDDLFSVVSNNRSAHQTYGREEVKESLRANLRLADLVTCTNTHLANVLSEFNPNVTVIPNYVPSFLLTMERPENEKLTLMWTGGISHQGDWLGPSKQVAALLRKYKDVDLLIGGHDIRKLLGRPDARYSPWTEFRDYYPTLQGDIGVIPLVDNPFSRSKSYIKFLEFSALGIPSVCSDVRPYREVVDHGVNGFLAKSHTDFYQHLRLLIEDEVARKEIGNAAKEWASTQTIEEHVVEYEVAFEKLLSG